MKRTIICTLIIALVVQVLMPFMAHGGWTGCEVEWQRQLAIERQRVTETARQRILAMDIDDAIEAWIETSRLQALGSRDVHITLNGELIGNTAEVIIYDDGDILIDRVSMWTLFDIPNILHEPHPTPPPPNQAINLRNFYSPQEISSIIRVEAQFVYRNGMLYITSEHAFQQARIRPLTPYIIESVANSQRQEEIRIDNLLAAEQEVPVNEPTPTPTSEPEIYRTSSPSGVLNPTDPPLPPRPAQPPLRLEPNQYDSMIWANISLNGQLLFDPDDINVRPHMITGRPMDSVWVSNSEFLNAVIVNVVPWIEEVFIPDMRRADIDVDATTLISIVSDLPMIGGHFGLLNILGVQGYGNVQGLGILTQQEVNQILSQANQESIAIVLGHVHILSRIRPLAVDRIYSLNSIPVLALSRTLEPFGITLEVIDNVVHIATPTPEAEE